MSEKVIVAVDAMGGDNAPEEIVKGAVESLQKSGKIFIKLVGKEDAVNAELAKYEYAKDRIEVVNATEVIETGEPPVKAVMKGNEDGKGRSGGCRGFCRKFRCYISRRADDCGTNQRD